ncbi:MAG: DNA-binding NarL/FixJ family response regulator [Glaciecola sp.]|jgi:DNA-binding NarL/FixJ family response regulator
MNETDNVLKALRKIANQNGGLSNTEISKILEAIVLIADYKEGIRTLLYFLKTMTPNRGSSYAKLTKREQQILHLIGIGQQNNDIAKRLKLSTSTIETHRKNIRKKLHITGTGKLLQYAILHNLHQNVLITVNELN